MSVNSKRVVLIRDDTVDTVPHAVPGYGIIRGGMLYGPDLTPRKVDIIDDNEICSEKMKRLQPIYAGADGRFHRGYKIDDKCNLIVTKSERNLCVSWQGLTATIPLQNITDILNVIVNNDAVFIDVATYDYFINHVMLWKMDDQIGYSYDSRMAVAGDKFVNLFGSWEARNVTESQRHVAIIYDTDDADIVLSVWDLYTGQRRIYVKESCGMAIAFVGETLLSATGSAIEAHYLPPARFSFLHINTYDSHIRKLAALLRVIFAVDIVEDMVSIVCSDIAEKHREAAGRVEMVEVF